MTDEIETAAQHAESTLEVQPFISVPAPARKTIAEYGKLHQFNTETARAAGLLSARKRRLAAMSGAHKRVAKEYPEVSTYYGAVEKLTEVQTGIALDPLNKHVSAAYRNVMDATGVDTEARLLARAADTPPPPQSFGLSDDVQIALARLIAAAAAGGAAGRAFAAKDE